MEHILKFSSRISLSWKALHARENVYPRLPGIATRDRSSDVEIGRPDAGKSARPGRLPMPGCRQTKPSASANRVRFREKSQFCRFFNTIVENGHFLNRVAVALHRAAVARARGSQLPLPRRLHRFISGSKLRRQDHESHFI
ncbi:hypothetical protein HPQ64_15060 [Rhizobiales bacterium]|uniref:hypothetical protein n=1 Tax=Hongsoonwoonella zoysiae TaxID=2821844 RepID=UPI00155FB90C|nr:hypothetical protein [Hongsoonwoonella zoysiae]NRG19010.1 hypothetical protein [Hongsoonwoonella zoysiae]